MFDTSFDQQRDLEALRSLLADGRADAIAESVIGPGVHRTLRPSTRCSAWLRRDSLVALTRARTSLRSRSVSSSFASSLDA